MAEEKNSMLAGLDDGHFILGTFGSNVSSGVSVTTIPERWDNSWANNVTLATLLDAAGIEFMLPVARWIGYGGQTNFEGNALECATWAAGLAAHTRHLNLIVTVHSSVHNPAVVAKQIATIDAISGGRVGLNIVAGWNQPEYAALGLELVANHGERYAFTQEWFDIIKKLWTSTEAFDWEGRFWKLKNILGDPRLSRHAPIINAGGSGDGQQFAVRNADLLFTVVYDLERSAASVKELKAKGREAGRKVGVICTVQVVCRPTEQEARDFFAYYCEQNSDWEQVDLLTELLFANSKSFPAEIRAQIRTGMAAGHGAYLLVGTPRQVADVSLIHSVPMLHDLWN